MKQKKDGPIRYFGNFRGEAKRKPQVRFPHCHHDAELLPPDKSAEMVRYVNSRGDLIMCDLHNCSMNEKGKCIVKSGNVQYINAPTKAYPDYPNS